MHTLPYPPSLLLSSVYIHTCINPPTKKERKTNTTSHQMYAGVIVLDGNRARFSVPDWKTALALKVLRSRLRDLLTRSFRMPGRLPTAQQEKWLDTWQRIFSQDFGGSGSGGGGAGSSDRDRERGVSVAIAGGGVGMSGGVGGGNGGGNGGTAAALVPAGGDGGVAMGAKLT